MTHAGIQNAVFREVDHDECVDSPERRRDADGRGLAADPEALSRAIGARRLALCDIAERRGTTRARTETAEKPTQVRSRRFGPPGTRQIADKSGRAKKTGLVAGVRPLVVAPVILLVPLAAASAYWVGQATAVSLPGSVDGATRASAVDPGLSRPERVEVERLLSGLRLETGRIDGDIDARTRRAIRTYWRFQGAEDPTGTATPVLLTNLREVTALMQTDRD